MVLSAIFLHAMCYNIIKTYFFKWKISTIANLDFVLHKFTNCSDFLGKTGVLLHLGTVDLEAFPESLSQQYIPLKLSLSHG